MVKNGLSKVLVGTLMLSSVAMADYSLIGVEGGLTSINYDIDNNNIRTSKTVTKSSENIGIKIGAESDNYRVFLNTNYYTNPNSSYDYIGTYGGEFDYLLNVSNEMNLYIGLNGGIANIKFKAPNETTSRTLSNPYYGVNAGLNYHASKLIDLELGTRLMMLDATNTKNKVTYRFNNFITAYASIIFKYNMD